MSELESFTDEVLQVADEETLRQFEVALAAKPEAGVDPAFWWAEESANEAARAWQERRSACHLSLVAGGAALRPVYALHEVETAGYPARIAGATTKGSGSH